VAQFIICDELTTAADDWAASCWSDGSCTACSCSDSFLRFHLDSQAPILHWLLPLQWFTQRHKWTDNSVQASIG